jgi:multidrug efflux system membrane fusion protein
VKKTYLMAGSVILVTVLWMLSGLFKAGHDKQDGDTDADFQKEAGAGSTRVRTTHSIATLERVEVVIRGRTEAKRIVDVRAETGGRVIKVNVEKGARVKAGDALCELAADDRPAMLAQAKASAAKSLIDYEGAIKLKEKGLLSDSQIAASKASLEAARAALKMAELEVEHLIMRAPFNAFVEDRQAEVGALMDRSAPCARLLDEASLLATGQASEREVAPLALAQTVRVQLSSGEQMQGKISFIARAADPQTRTYRIEAALDIPNDRVRDGMTAQITVPLQAFKAHRITPAVLALDDAGGMGVRIVNAEKRVEFHHVDVIRESLDGIWVTGLPEEIDLITVGQELVADGDLVETSTDHSGAGQSMSADAAKKRSDSL